MGFGWLSIANGVAVFHFFDVIITIDCEVFQI